MSELEQQLKHQARLHTQSGAAALGLLFTAAEGRIKQLEQAIKEIENIIKASTRINSYTKNTWCELNSADLIKVRELMKLTEGL